jgi:hypothetical protein
MSALTWARARVWAPPPRWIVTAGFAVFTFVASVSDHTDPSVSSIRF